MSREKKDENKINKEALSKNKSLKSYNSPIFKSGYNYDYSTGTNINKSNLTFQVLFFFKHNKSFYKQKSLTFQYNFFLRLIFIYT